MAANSSRRLSLIIIVFIARFGIPERVFNLPSYARMLSWARSSRAFYFRVPCPFSSLSLSRFLFPVVAVSLVLFFFQTCAHLAREFVGRGNISFVRRCDRRFSIISPSSRTRRIALRRFAILRPRGKSPFRIAPMNPFR